jgi:hypothetical protein
MSEYQNIMPITDDEMKELNDLRLAINHNIASVHPKKQERFTELFVKSIEGKGDCRQVIGTPNY